MKLLEIKAFVWFESNFAIWRACPICGSEELSYRLFVVYVLLHFAGSKLYLVPKLWYILAGNVLIGDVYLSRRCVRCADCEDMGYQFWMPSPCRSNALI